jgi:hypothetical protein
MLGPRKTFSGLGAVTMDICDAMVVSRIPSERLGGPLFHLVHGA